jgi:hypothetical protein
MGTTVACLRVSETGPAVLSGHLEGEQPILIYRVAEGRLSGVGVCS